MESVVSSVVMVGYREYARHRSCSLKAVQKAIAAGRIPAPAVDLKRKKIDRDAADLAWAGSTDPSRQRGQPAPVSLPAPAALPIFDDTLAQAPAALAEHVWTDFGPIPPRNPVASQVIGGETFLAVRTRRE